MQLLHVRKRRVGAALESDCVHPERACQPSDLEPYVAQAHDQYRRSLELSRRVVVPALFLFVAEQTRQTLGESQEAEEAELGQGTGVDPAWGGEDQPCRLS